MTDDIERYIGPIFKAYAVWDVDRQDWHRPALRSCKLLPGIWFDPDDIVTGIKIPNYRIIDFDFSRQLPEDIVRVLKLGETPSDKRNLVIVKLRQLIEIHVFQNWELRQQLKEAPHALGTGIRTVRDANSRGGSL